MIFMLPCWYKNFNIMKYLLSLRVLLRMKLDNSAAPLVLIISVTLTVVLVYLHLI